VPKKKKKKKKGLNNLKERKEKNIRKKRKEKKYPGKSLIHCMDKLLMIRSNCSGANGRYSSSTTIRTGFTNNKF
jgi:hypothetical protein